MDTAVSISEAAEASGLSEDTLRYYERIDVITDVDRAANGHRRYTGGTLMWLGLVVRLRSSGMALETIQRYAELYRQGPATISQRRSILANHQAKIASEAKRLSDLDAMLQNKIDMYDAAVADGMATGGPCEMPLLEGRR